MGDPENGFNYWFQAIDIEIRIFNFERKTYLAPSA